MNKQNNSLEVLSTFFEKFPIDRDIELEFSDEEFLCHYLWLRGYKVVPILELPEA